MVVGLALLAAVLLARDGNGVTGDGDITLLVLVDILRLLSLLGTALAATHGGVSRSVRYEEESRRKEGGKSDIRKLLITE